MNRFALYFAFFATVAVAQNTIPPGTVLPVQLNRSLSSQTSKPGQTITGRIAQDVATSAGGKIRAGTKIYGHVLAVQAATAGAHATITLRFDRLNLSHRSIAINTSLRALASMTQVEDSFIPPSGPDRGTPAAWTTRNLIGGEVAYGEDGPEARGDEIVGHALLSGVLLPVRANHAAGCRGEFGDNAQPQAMWVFSSDACGVYGIDGVQISHAGRSAPLGEITLTNQTGDFNIRGGSGMLLRVNLE